MLIIVKDEYTYYYTHICKRKSKREKDGHVWIFGSMFISHGGSAKLSIVWVVVVVVVVAVGVHIRTVRDTEFRN